MNTRSHQLPYLFTLIAVLLSASAHSNWIVTSLHPAGASNSYGYDVAGGIQAGAAYHGIERHAGIWSGTANSWIDLHPNGYNDSVIFGTDGVSHVGTVEGNAALWHGQSGAWTNLGQGQAFDVFGNQQVGKFWVPNQGQHASIWSGSAESRVDLNPAGASLSLATDIFENTQVGEAGFEGVGVHAGLWTGTAESWVDLHPSGAVWSGANSVSATSQAGYWQDTNYLVRAALWHGSATSMIDLHPNEAYESQVLDVTNNYQVGYVSLPGDYSRATLWSGTAESIVNLHSFLPSRYIGSVAYSVWSESGTNYVLGIAGNSETEQGEAMLWTQTVPEPSTVVLIASGFLGIVSSKRRLKRI